MHDQKTLALLLAAASFAAAGCVSTPRTPLASPASVDARSLPMFDGRSGAPLGWEELLSRAAASDVIILAEQHDDAVGHAVQLAIVEDVLERWPDGAVALEMLERDEQVLVDDYLDDVIDADQLAEQTFSTRWAGAGSWASWYQPVIDAAKRQDAPVIAANAPRRYVRLARTDGYDRLQELPSSRRTLVDLPGDMPVGRYRERFWSVMGAHAPAQDDEPTPDEPTPDEPTHGEPTHGEPTHGEPTHGEDAQAEQDEMIESMFRSQLVWDATMAESIAEARRNGASRVLHLVGQFHADFDGGLVQELRRRMPAARIMVISLQRADADSLREDDQDRADVIVYTGAN